MKRRILLLACLLLVACSPLSSQPKPFFLYLATDLHYYSTAMFEDGPRFQEAELYGDGKYLRYTTNVTDAMLEFVSAKKGTPLIITGDLTYNGERQSHLEIVEKLRALEKNGNPVYVIPGNHDIKDTAWSIKNEKSEPVAGITQSEFRKMYGEFGYDEARFKDPSSFSYASVMGDDLWLIMLDANTVEEPYHIKQSTLNWLEDVLKEAEKEEACLITASHQSLLTHNKHFTLGYQITNADQVIDILKDYPPFLHLCGHLHIQHIAENKYFREVSTSSLSVSPHHLGEVNCTSYGVTNAFLDMEFLSESKIFYRHSTASKVLRSLMNSGYSEQERQVMADFVAAMNECYFSGDHEKLLALKDTEGYKLWQTATGVSTYAEYVIGVFDEQYINHQSKEFFETDIK